MPKLYVSGIPADTYSRTFSDHFPEIEDVMFLFREYAVCLFLSLMLAGFVVAVCGIGYLLKVTSTMAWQALQAHNFRKVICTGTKPIVMADETS